MQAYSSYSDALNVSEFNPNNYIYYCNRATASFYMKNYDDVMSGMFLMVMIVNDDDNDDESNH